MIDIEKMKALAAHLRDADGQCRECKMFETAQDFSMAATAIESLLSELEAREADRRDAGMYRGLLGALLCGDIPMKESSISLNVCGVPPNQDEFNEAVAFCILSR
ncbi:hypothetical protein KDX40_04685 [Burkholderia ambifaria]|uniref:hypothetical protein n=1 Tax=Burkholderia ambifaria TaxID=152480 RepID=UPI001BA355E1|nr:hypothetical protein [Burkholderia ambifaria]MBR8343034.1 hypothetical protein [Burkholderia ambifaria]